MELPDLDKTCIKILPIFLVEKKPFQFNELFRFLNKNGLKISKPTLSTHLKHLTEKEMLTRTEVENKQYVYYHFNWKKWDNLEEVVERQKEFQKILDEERETFNSKKPISQLADAHLVLVLRNLLQLKHELLKIMEPEKEFEHTLQVIAYGTIWESTKKLLMDNFIEKNDEYRKAILNSIEELIIKYKNI